MTASVLPLKIDKRRSGDLLLLFSVIGLSLTGLLFVYSASKYSAEISYGDKFYFAKKHVIGLLLGYTAMTFGCFFDTENIKKRALCFLRYRLFCFVSYSRLWDMKITARRDG